MVAGSFGTVEEASHKALCKNKMVLVVELQIINGTYCKINNASDLFPVQLEHAQQVKVASGTSLVEQK